jgi:cytochrome c-type protein NapB
MPAEPGRSTDSSAGMKIFGAVVITVCLIGFLMGTSPDRYQAIEAPQRPSEPGLENSGAVPPARRHDELARHAWGTDDAASRWRLTTQALQPLPLAELNPEALYAGRSGSRQTPITLTDRAINRAYDGAPPTVPHPIRQGSAAECLACHRDGLTIGNATASPIPHAELASCTQCHVVASSPIPGSLPPSAAARAPNDFEGLASPSEGARWNSDAPPVIPHQTLMRERCVACHGPHGKDGMHSTHPERQSCTQCHAPSAELDQRLSPQS